jgi:hypothetical protein
MSSRVEVSWTSAGLLLSALLVTQQLAGWAWGHAKRRGLRTIPGPKGYPLLGIIGQMPQQEAWKVYDDWRKEFGTFPRLSLLHGAYNSSGDMIYFELFGKRFLILNSISSINDLLASRASIYSDRIYSPAAQM